MARPPALTHRRVFAPGAENLNGDGRVGNPREDFGLARASWDLPLEVVMRWEPKWHTAPGGMNALMNMRACSLTVVVVVVIVVIWKITENSEKSIFKFAR